MNTPHTHSIEPRCATCLRIRHALGLKTQLRSQQGGTLLGIIIGLVIGLAIALAVSLYMRSGDLSFLKRDSHDKPSRVEVPKDAAKIPDPNEALYGKGSREQKPAAADVVPGKPGDPAGTQSGAARGLGIDAGKAPTDAAAAASKTADPIGKLAEAVAKTPPPPAPKASDVPVDDDGSRYLIQVGAFKSPEEAESMRAKVAMMGFEARVSQRETDTGTMHRVRIGPLTSLEASNQARRKLSEAGMEASIIKIK
jgi:cell division protein FtsN